MHENGNENIKIIPKKAAEGEERKKLEMLKYTHTKN